MAIDLSKVGAEEFEAAVNADVRGTASIDTQMALRQPECLDRWHDMLLHLKRNVEAQLTSNRASLLAEQAERLAAGDTIGWIKSKAESEQWRQRSIRFKNGVEERLREAKRLRNGRGESMVTSITRDRDKAIAKLVTLEEAISAHKAAVLADAEDPDTIDDRLWSVLG
jgi:plasmid maintenance system antidote protein VapI